MYMVSRKIPMCEDAYVFSYMLFKKILLKMDSLRSVTDRSLLSYNNRIMLSKLDKNLKEFTNLELIFKTCMYLAYKMIEDEFSLFIKDYASVTKDDWAVIHRLEIFLVCDVLHFGLMSLKNVEEEVREERRFL
jgi:hypothetical protein